MRIEAATAADVVAIARSLHEVNAWLAEAGKALWPDSEIDVARVRRDVAAGVFFVARDGGESEQLAGVMKFELDDAIFWPEIEAGGSAFVHKLAVRRQWAKQGVSTALLVFARERTRALGRAHLRLDVVADRAGPRAVYERFGFVLHSTVERYGIVFARYELALTDREERDGHSRRQTG